jgi:hypothetical protein
MAPQTSLSLLLLVWDAVKIALGAVTLPLAWHLIGRRSR